VACLLGNVQNVDRSESSGEEGLVGVAPSGVHDQAAGVVANGLGKGSGTLLDNDGSPARQARLRGVQRLFDVGRVGDRRNGDLLAQLRLALLAHDRATVDRKVTEVAQQLLSSVLGRDKRVQLGRVIHELLNIR
jgi:hypothetical protein